jgi:hypothetical protein
MTWCASTGSYLTHIARSCWNCARKVNPSNIYAGCLAFFFIDLLPAHLNMPTHNLFPSFRSWCRSPSHRACQEGEGADRYARSCRHPNPLYFKSFISCHCFLSSHCFDFKSFQMIRLHWRHATRTVCPQWMWPSNWTIGMPLTRSRQSS